MHLSFALFAVLRKAYSVSIMTSDLPAKNLCPIITEVLSVLGAWFVLVKYFFKRGFAFNDL